jgi:hypothetical protein
VNSTFTGKTINELQEYTTCTINVPSSPSALLRESAKFDQTSVHKCTCRDQTIPLMHFWCTLVPKWRTSGKSEFNLQQARLLMNFKSIQHVLLMNFKSIQCVLLMFLQVLLPYLGKVPSLTRQVYRSAHVMTKSFPLMHFWCTLVPKWRTSGKSEFNLQQARLLMNFKSIQHVLLMNFKSIQCVLLMFLQVLLPYLGKVPSLTRQVYRSAHVMTKSFH